MKLKRGFLLLSLFGVAVARAQEPVQEAIPNWPAPETWSPHSVNLGASTMAAITSPLPFIGLAPCRIVDTRGNGAPITGGMFTASQLRNYAVAGICGIPGSARALSLNITVTGPGQTGAGFLLAFPTGATPPPVSSLNWDHAPATVGNAAVVPTNTSTSFAINVSGPTHVIIDVNGYYAPAGVGIYNTFLGDNAGNFTMTGESNAAIGSFAFFSNTSGAFNTAVGVGALQSNTSGNANTAIGYTALPSNQTGGNNTAVGYQALYNSKGSNNIGIGDSAGLSQQTGSHDIYIGNAGVNGESNTIRIGNASFQDGGTIITGIAGFGAVGGSPVYVTGGGRLGTSTSSSRRFKQNIRGIAGESDRLMRLRPVAFRYKAEFDPTGATQYGLIAEEVAEVFPDLVTSDRDGQPEGVLYHLIPPLLLNEVQKQQRTVEAQEKTIEQQKVEIEGLKARLARLEARLLTESRP